MECQNDYQFRKINGVDKFSWHAFYLNGRYILDTNYSKLYYRTCRNKLFFWFDMDAGVSLLDPLDM